ncbi:hypothetical protein ABZP36_000085 [Zizania latifolia]
MAGNEGCRRGVHPAVAAAGRLDLRREIQRHLCLALVRRVPFFSQMDEHLLVAIYERLVLSLSTKDAYIIREGDPVSEMLFIIRGTSSRLRDCSSGPTSTACSGVRWPDEYGVQWREVLQANAWREFEEARDERDPEVVARLLIGGCDAVQQALDRLAEASRHMVEAEEAKRRGGP